MKKTCAYKQAFTVHVFQKGGLNLILKQEKLSSFLIKNRYTVDHLYTNTSMTHFMVKFSFYDLS